MSDKRDKPELPRKSVNDLTHEEWVECVVRVVDMANHTGKMGYPLLRKGIGNFLDSYKLHIDEGNTRPEEAVGKGRVVNVCACGQIYGIELQNCSGCGRTFLDGAGIQEYEHEAMAKLKGGG